MYNLDHCAYFNLPTTFLKYHGNTCQMAISALFVAFTQMF